MKTFCQIPCVYTTCSLQQQNNIPAFKLSTLSTTFEENAHHVNRVIWKIAGQPQTSGDMLSPMYSEYQFDRVLIVTQHLCYIAPLTKGICCAKVVCAVALMINMHLLLEDQSSHASYWTQKSRIFRRAGGKGCSRKHKVTGIDVEREAGTSLIREQTESRYICLNVCFVNWV